MTSAKPIVAVIPMKPLKASKSRLSPALAPGQREALTLNMLRRVVRAAARAPLEQVWVVGGDPAIRHVAEEEGAAWYTDRTSDLNSCLEHAFKDASDRGLAPLYLPGDLPLLDWPDIEGFVSNFRQRTDLVLSPDVRGEGTNALLLRIGSPLSLSLGPGSFQRHLELAQSAGLAVAIYHSPSLSLDLDTPEDLAALERQRPGLLNELIEEE